LRVWNERHKLLARLHKMHCGVALLAAFQVSLSAGGHSYL
jgi:hypothetical protein